MQTIYGSHAAIPPFRLLRPERAEEASAARADLGAEAMFLAGGVDLVPAMRAGLRVVALISLDRIRSLAAIERKEAAIRIGAGLTYAGFAAHSDIRAAMPDFAAVFAGVANIRVRHAATLGGNIMARNPAFDLMPALLALDAKLVFVDRSGRRVAVGAAEAAFPDGLLAEIEIPLGTERRFVFERGYKPALSLAVAVERRGSRLAGRVAIGCAHVRPIALSLDLGQAADHSALAERADAVAEDFAARMPAPLADAAASAEYRRTLSRVLLSRALRGLAKPA